MRSAVKDNTVEELKELSLALHYLQVKCDLFSAENKGL
jgi:hypothetical protein